MGGKELQLKNYSNFGRLRSLRKGKALFVPIRHNIPFPKKSKMKFCEMSAKALKPRRRGAKQLAGKC